MFQSMCALKIYMRRGDIAQGAGFWQKLFRKPLAAAFIERAMNAGITHASLSYGNMGFAKGDRGVVSDINEIPFESLPVCVELVGPKPLLEQFVREQGRQLVGTTLVLLEGVHVRAHLAEESETSSDVRVQYLKVGKEGQASAVPQAEQTAGPTEATAPCADAP